MERSQPALWIKNKISKPIAACARRRRSRGQPAAQPRTHPPFNPLRQTRATGTASPCRWWAIWRRLPAAQPSLRLPRRNRQGPPSRRRSSSPPPLLQFSNMRRRRLLKPSNPGPVCRLPRLRVRPISHSRPHPATISLPGCSTVRSRRSPHQQPISRPAAVPFPRRPPAAAASLNRPAAVRRNPPPAAAKKKSTPISPSPHAQSPRPVPLPAAVPFPRRPPAAAASPNRPAAVRRNPPPAAAKRKSTLISPSAQSPRPVPLPAGAGPGAGRLSRSVARSISPIRSRPPAPRVKFRAK